MKNSKFYLSAIATSILASFVGLTAIGCSTPVISAIQESPQAKTNSAIANAQKAIPSPTTPNVDLGNSKGTEQPQVTLASSANKPQDLPLQKGMTYEEARQIILEQGWKPNPNVKSNLRSPVVKAIFDRGYTEIEDCSGTGEAPCRYEFVNQNGEMLYVVTAGRDSLVRNWWIEKKSDSQKEPTSDKIQAGLYWVGPTDEGLEIQAERFRYYDESGFDNRWQPNSELKYIKNNVVFYGENYWCLSTLMPKDRMSTCSANGWMKAETLPFTGTRRFNFLGGSGTGQSITIESNGDTLVQLHGTMQTSVLYRGKFSNPIVLEDGVKLLLEGDRIYILGPKQHSAKDCKPTKENPCEANLY
jgi:hypothetical protein